MVITEARSQADATDEGEEKTKSCSANTDEENRLHLHAIFLMKGHVEDELRVEEIVRDEEATKDTNQAQEKKRDPNDKRCYRVRFWHTSPYSLILNLLVRSTVPQLPHFGYITYIEQFPQVSCSNSGTTVHVTSCLQLLQ